MAEIKQVLAGRKVDLADTISRLESIMRGTTKSLSTTTSSMPAAPSNPTPTTLARQTNLP
ncbi:hypothetical protein H2248_004360, partial [Termitomyces sp. 'cryptogamus']